MADVSCPGRIRCHLDELERIGFLRTSTDRQSADTWGLSCPRPGEWVFKVGPTSTSARPCDFRPTSTIDGTETRVLVEQTTAVNAETRLNDFAGRLDAEELTELDRALALVLGLF